MPTTINVPIRAPKKKNILIKFIDLTVDPSNKVKATIPAGKEDSITVGEDGVDSGFGRGEFYAAENIIGPGYPKWNRLNDYDFPKANDPIQITDADLP